MTGLLELNLSASLLIISIIIIRALFKNRLPKRFFAWVWSVVILRLVVPFSIPWQISLIPPDYLIPAVNNITGANPPIGFFDDEGVFKYEFGMTAEKGEQIRSFGDLFIIISLIVTVLLLTLFTVNHLRYRKRYVDALPYGSGILDCGLRRKVSLKYSDRISAPITYGIINPVIVLPKSCTEEDFRGRETVLAHEIEHIRCFDVLYKWIITAVTCLYWYNPFVWLMFLLSDRDIEIACDISAMNKSGAGREEYSALLIGLEERRSMDICARGFSAGAIKKRIKSVMKSRKTGIVSVIIAVVLSLCSFTVFVSAHTSLNADLSMWVPIHLDDSDVNELLWLEPQKYYLEGGTKEQYIEVYPDNTLQIFGYDFKADFLEREPDIYDNLTESEIELQNEYFARGSSYWNSRHPYTLPSIAVIFLDDFEGQAQFLSYTDENTIMNGSLVYKAENPTKAGVYQAYDMDKEPAFGYYYSDKDDSYIYMFYNVLEIYDGKGGRSGPISFVQVKQDSRPNEIILATNRDRLSEEEPQGYILGDDEASIYDPVSGNTYRLRSKPVFG